jgi:bacterioferritin (cytochrome b1)
MPDRKTQKLLDGLQQDLTRELQSVLQYTYQSALVLGPRALNIREYLRKEAENELEHVTFLADQIVNLGEIPSLRRPSSARQRMSSRCWRMILI